MNVVYFNQSLQDVRNLPGLRSDGFKRDTIINEAFPYLPSPEISSKEDLGTLEFNLR